MHVVPSLRNMQPVPDKGSTFIRHLVGKRATGAKRSEHVMGDKRRKTCNLWHVVKYGKTCNSYKVKTGAWLTNFTFLVLYL